MVSAPNRLVSGSEYICGCWPIIAQTIEEKERGGERRKTGGTGSQLETKVVGFQRMSDARMMGS
jgi:hypothetical protein